MLKNWIRRLTGRPVLAEQLSYEDARSVLERHDRAARRELASRTDAPPETLYYLEPKQDLRLRRIKEKRY